MTPLPLLHPRRALLSGVAAVAALAFAAGACAGAAHADGFVVNDQVDIRG